MKIKFEEYAGKITKTYIFLLPGMKEFLPEFKNSMILNAYLGDVNYPEYHEHLFILMKFNGKREFSDMENAFEKINIFEHSYDIRKYYVMKVFKIPYPIKEDYIKFVNSKFSKLSEEHKKKIMQYHRLPKHHDIMNILYKREAAYIKLELKLNTQVPRNLEASSVLNMKTEIFEYYEN